MAFSPVLFPNGMKESKVKNIGIQLWTVKDILTKDTKNVLTQLASFGYKELEAFGMDNEAMKGFFTAENKKLIDDLGMKLVSSHVMPNRLKDKSVKEGLDVFAPTWKKTVELGLKMGLKYITIPWTEEHFRQNPDGFKQTAEAFNLLAEYVNKQGLKFTYHNHSFEFEAKEGQVMYDVLLKECDPKYVDFEMDLYWVTLAGKDPIAYINQYPGRFPLWHVKDMSKNNPKENSDLGQGSIDFKKIFQFAKKAGCKHFLVEQESGFNPDSMSSAKNGCQYLKNLNY